MWQLTANIRGPQGEEGPEGKSSYEIAVENGFTGSESQWLSSLIGTNGTDGTDGQPGNDGSDGIDGANGLSAYQVALASGFVGSQSAWLASLVGPQGPTGATGPAGTSVTITTVNSQAAYDAATPTATQLIVRIA